MQGLVPLSRSLPAVCATQSAHQQSPTLVPPSHRHNLWLNQQSGGRHKSRAERRCVHTAVSRLDIQPNAAAVDVSTAPLPLTLTEAGPTTPKPSYEAIDSQLHNRLFMHLFRAKLAEGLGEDAPEPGFDGIITLTRLLNKRYRPQETQRVTQGILKSLLPPGLPAAFKVLFAGPLPVFSQRLNAAVTAATCQWLMGPSEVNDVELPGGEILVGQGVKVERCRVLEESGCASVCINSCKVPTQAFFSEDMGMKLRMAPNYEDFSCQFSFGLAPLPESEDEAFKTPCFMQCPTKRRHMEAAAEAQCFNVVPVAPKVPVVPL